MAVKFRKRIGIEVVATDCTSCMFVDGPCLNADKSQSAAIGSCEHWQLRMATWAEGFAKNMEEES